VFPVPVAARTSCWLNAWLDGRVATDDVVGGLAGPGQADFCLTAGATPLSPALLLAELRRLGVTQVSAALPLPGHLIGLGGPAVFNQDALEAGQALVLRPIRLGLVPLAAGSGLRWRGAPADPPGYLPDVASADRELREALRDATERLVDLDVMSWNPEIADAIMNLRAPDPTGNSLPFASPRAAHTAMSGLRAAAIVALADQEESGPISAAEMELRHQALQPLHLAARTAVVAACSAQRDHGRD
jgi:hypothetical protein